MQYQNHELHPRSWIISYEKDGKQIAAMLSVAAAIHLLYLADITQAEGPTADTFKETECLIATVRKPQGPEQEEREEWYKVPACDIIRDLSEEEIMRVIVCHETTNDIARMGYTGALETYRKELRTIRRQLEANTRKLQALGQIAPL